MNFDGGSRRPLYLRKRRHNSIKAAVYSYCFVIAMIGGVVMCGHLDKSGFFNHEAFAASKNEDASTASTASERAPISLNSAKTEEGKRSLNSEKSNQDSSYIPPVTNDSYQINEQFDGVSLNTSLWTIMERPKGYRNNEEQAYAASQVGVYDGHLVITAQRNQNGEWISGEVNSKWAYTYGDFEVRARLSASGPGVWPAAWLFDKNGEWPGGGELDIYESVDAFPSVYGTIHGSGTNGHWQLQSGVHNTDPREYHTYRISKQPGVISWWVDGVKRSEWRPDMLTSDQQWPFENHTYIGLLNLAIGGAWPSQSDPSTPDEVKYYVDYFTVKNAHN